MREIKTIVKSADLYVPQNKEHPFDEEVNALLREGWTLRTRDLRGNWLYAELERVIITEAERCCDNCEHGDKTPDSTPCCYCDDASQWEDVKD